MKNILIAICLSLTLVLLAAFILFAAFRYLDRKNDIPERIFFIIMSVFCFAMAIVTFIGITQI